MNIIIYAIGIAVATTFAANKPSVKEVTQEEDPIELEQVQEDVAVEKLDTLSISL